MRYIIHLTSGAALEGDDERTTMEIVQAVAVEKLQRPSPNNEYEGDDDFPIGWVWVAEHHLDATAVIGVSAVRQP